ncbi:hypothetical protein COCMIDRAFT_35100 [Bipolaris oryzae ATCC 44560]|uniref:Uncharacterized protein n=1 Tax=Bipolaris oryzae ATCC 44560 TaxID=930090 RepID=W6ZBQ9_COCMI|nr:uncharacterized protein COCMIDRAFT_35100 [Bipolaris oryzae ATCC 44560]EUC47415.1 hypothetical protein COCMIDRAFT_35100 [Bipolaris oryzae ATCC 44560]
MSSQMTRSTVVICIVNGREHGSGKEIAIVWWVTKAGPARSDPQPLEHHIAPQGFCQRPLLQVLGSFAPPSTWPDSQRYQVKVQVQAFANPFDICPVGCGCDCAFVQSLGTLHDQHQFSYFQFQPS